MTEEREMTALMTSVGAEVGQSPNVTTDIISDYGDNFNPSAEEMFEAQMQYQIGTLTTQKVSHIL